MKIIIFALVLIASIYILYMQGFLMIQSKSALLFVVKNRGKKARFSSCTGKIQRVLRIKETKIYQFQLETELSNGIVEVKLKDRRKQTIVTLNNTIPSASITLDVQERYYLIIEFERASGKYVLDWI